MNNTIDNGKRVPRGSGGCSMLIFGITIAIIFILLAFYAFRLVSKVLYLMFLMRLFGGIIPKFGGQNNDSDS